jgi:hypothetical protein
MPYMPLAAGLASLAKKSERPWTAGERLTELLVSLNSVQADLGEIEAALEALEHELT